MIAEYLRKSRAEELMDSDDEVLAKHRAYLADYASAHGIVVNDVYEEVVSGESIAARPEMQKLLAAVRKRKYSAVLCMDIDRLGRGGMQDQGAILDAFRETDTLIITPDKTYDLSNEQDEMLTEFKSFMSRQEYKIIRKRMRRGLMQTIEAGGYVANPPYGYRPCKVGKLPSLEIVPEEADFIRHIYKRYQEGVGATTIAEELNALGSVPRRNGHWTRSTVRVVLRNPTYKGMVAWNRVKRNKPGTEAYEKQHAQYMKEDDWILVPGKHPAIIPPDEWARVQEIRVAKHIPSKKTGKTTNPLAGLMICSKCGMRMQRMNMNKKVPYLLCTRPGCCAGAKFDLVEESVLKSLTEILDRLRSTPEADPAPDNQELLAAINAELRKTDARLDRLFEFLEDGTYDRATFKARRAELESKKARLLSQRESLEAPSPPTVQETRDAIQTVLKDYPTLDAGERNMALKSVIDHITYNKEKKTKPADFTVTIKLKNFD